MDTVRLSRYMIAAGLRAFVTCVDPKHLAKEFAGREFDVSFLNELPQSVDPCGEYGEFHTFAFDGPMFSYPINVKVGEIIEREGFVFADVYALHERSGTPVTK
jgi:diphthamide synthase (EF-2-diphthine--ammonia ligase)